MSSLRKDASITKRFVRELLRGDCSDVVFSRGVEYFEQGRVRKVEFSGSTAAAVVQGSRRYKVSIRFGNDHNGRTPFHVTDYGCTCPYDMGGSCKHVVAALLALFEAQREENAAHKGGSREYDADREGSNGSEDRRRSAPNVTAGRRAARIDPPSKRTPPTATLSDVVISQAFRDLSRIRGRADLGAGKGQRSLQASANKLFRRFDELQRLVILSPEGVDQASSEQLSLITENVVRQWSPPRSYLTGLQYFMEGRVSEQRVWRSILSGTVNVHRKKGVAARFLPWVDDDANTSYSVRIEMRGLASPAAVQEGSYLHAGAYCQCAQDGMRDACPHLVALLLSWVRNPRSFKQSPEMASPNEGRIDGQKQLPSLVKATARVLDALDEMVSCIASDGSSRADVLEMLQLTYSKMRLASSQLAERWSEISSGHESEPLVVSSFIIDVIASRVLSALDSRYFMGAVQLKNKAEVDAIGKALQSFAESVGREQHFPEPSGVGNERRQEKPPVVSPFLQETRAESRLGEKRVTRSWDKIVEEFSR